MALENSADPALGTPGYGTAARGAESSFSAVSWGAIIAGGVVAAAMALILTSLGAGLGLLALSPWKVDESRIAAIGIGTIIWSVIIEVIAFGLGGYVAGRLRTKWARLHGDEVYFRDTAHGFVVWALGTLISACLVTSAIGAVGHGAAATAGAGLEAAGAGAGAAGMMAARGAEGDNGAHQASANGGPIGYFTDMMLRSGGSPGAGATSGTAASPNTTAGATGNGTTAANPQNDEQSRVEVSRILVQSIAAGNLSDNDKAYLAQLVSARTGLSQQDAQKRVDDVTGQFKSAIDTAKEKAKEAADVARKTLAGLALWGFISMLIGAFSASLFASLGGRARDQY
jgi:hypothetical protein